MKNNQPLAVAFLAVAAAAIVIMSPDIAHAGANATEFDDVWQTLKDWTQGTLGRVIAGTTVLVGLFMGVARQSIMSFAIGLGSGIGLYNAPTVIENILTAALPVAVNAASGIVNVPTL